VAPGEVITQGPRAHNGKRPGRGKKNPAEGGANKPAWETLEPVPVRYRSGTGRARVGVVRQEADKDARRRHLQPDTLA
jgi:hypothetical protein